MPSTMDLNSCAMRVLPSKLLRVICGSLRWPLGRPGGRPRFFCTGVGPSSLSMLAYP